MDGYVAGQLSMLWLGYSLDGASIVTIMDIPDTGWLSGIHPPFQTTSLNISGVPDGQHRIEVIARGYCTGIIGVYEYNVTSTPSYFTVDTTNSSSAPNPTASTKSTPTSPSSTPTQNPTQTPSPILTPSPSPTPIIRVTPSSSVPDFPSVFIVSFLMVTILAGAIVYRKKLK